MATDIEPNLEKPPPHLEGYLLKQNPRSRLGRRGWKSYFFFVRKDKLLYYLKQEDAYGGQKPILSVPLPTVTSITECEFDGVPKKHHINCGFTVVTHNITLNLLAEKPEDARKWVRDLCYVKAYWSKMEVRTTILSVEQEKELLRIAIEEEKNAVGLLEGHFGLHDNEQHGRRDSSASTTSSSRISSQMVTIYLACDSKELVSVLYTDTVLEVLDKLSDKLASSESVLWVVDNRGRDILPGLSEQLLSYDPRAHKFYVLEPSFWVVVAFFTNGKYEIFPALTTVTANEMVEAPEISFHKDMMGMGNPGVFLKDSNSEDVLFGNNECPFQVLFDVDSNGTRRRLPVGHLLIKNKSLAGGKRYRTTRFVHTPVQANEDSQLELNKQIAEEEKVQRAALDLLTSRQKGEKKKTMEEVIEECESTELVDAVNSSPLCRRPAVRRSPLSRKKIVKEEENTSGFVDSSDTTGPMVRQRGGSSVVESHQDSAFGKESRTKSLGNILQSDSDNISELEKTVNLGPKVDNSDQLVTKEKLELESSKKISPVVMRKAMDMKRGRDRRGTLFDEDDTSPVLRHKHNIVSGTAAAAAAAAAASKSEKNQSKQDEPSNRQRINSTTNADKRKSTDFIPGNKFANRKIDYNNEEARLVALFDQPAQESEPVSIMSPVDILAKSLNEKSQIGNLTTPADQDERPTRALISINIADLQPYPAVSPNSPGGVVEPYDVKTPAMLRLVQREASENPQGNRFKMISLSGVILTSGSNGWCVTEGSNYHDSVNLDTGDHCEIFTLSDGVKATYHHGNKRWYVQPQMKATGVSSSSLEPSDNEGGLPVSAGVVTTPDFESKRKLLVQNLNKAVQDILQHFGKVRQEAEKIKLGDEAVNPVVGQLMRCYTCPAILSILQDWKKPYRFEGIVIDSLWDVIVSLCKAGISTKIHTIPHAYKTFSMAQQVVNDVNRELPYREDDEKCQWFIISTIRAQLLTAWLECIPYLKETIKKYYLPGAFLMEATSSAEKLYKDAILIIDPLQHLPFKLYSQRPVVQAEPMVLPPVMKTHAATGQRSGPITGESAATAVTSRPVDQPDNGGSRLRVAEQSLKNIQEGRVSPVPTSTQSSSSGKGWFKKLVEGLDRGGAITGRPSPQQQEQRRVDSPVPSNNNTVSSVGSGTGGSSIKKKILNSLNVGYAITGPPTVQSSSRKVIALYNNVGEEGDELTFNQGDVLTVLEQLNAEWLMCQLGTESGIVPANYVKQANDN